MAYTPPYAYNPYNPGGFYQPPMPDQLAQMRMSQQYQSLNNQSMVGQTMQNTTAAMGFSSVSRPVTNREEAMAAQIPFDGSISVFTDVQHGKIYTKAFNFNDGSSIFKTYVLEEPAEKEKVSNNSETGKEQITHEELEKIKSDIKGLREKYNDPYHDIEDLKWKVEELQKQIQEVSKIKPCSCATDKKGVKKNVTNDEQQ